MSAWAIVVVVANSVGRSYPVHSISISAVAPQGRHRRAEPGSPPGWPAVIFFARTMRGLYHGSLFWSAT